MEIPYGYCHCGCGEMAPVSTESDFSKGWKKGQPKKYIKNHYGISSVEEYKEIDMGYSTPCWVWQRYTDKDGYGTKSVEGVLKRSHVAFYEMKYGLVPNGKQLHHKCECKSCCNPDHMEPVTNTENQQIHGKLDWEIVNQIRGMRGNNHAFIAKQFNIHTSMVSLILSNKRWKV